MKKEDSAPAGVGVHLVVRGESIDPRFAERLPLGGAQNGHRKAYNCGA